jgi:hypothetical protein
VSEIARRSLSKVTYAPIRPNKEDERSGAVLKRQRGLDKIVFANALAATEAEIDAAKAKVDPNSRDSVGSALDALRGLRLRSGRSRAAWPAIAAIPTDVLINAARTLAGVRRNHRLELREHAAKLASDHAAFVRRTLEQGAAASTQPKSKRASVAPAAILTNDPRLNAASLKPGFAAAIEWARVREPARVDALAALARKVTGVAVDHSNLSILDWDGYTDTVVGTDEDTPDWTDDLTDGFAERMKVEPIGRLHLERIDMTPVGVIRGELVHSVGLAPAETVTVIHREWSSREVSFEKVVTEEFEQSTEEGVTENTELASATDTQSRHSTALSMEASGSGSWGFASASASVGYNSTSDDETAKKDSRNHSISVTRKASSRTRKEHKDTFTVKEQAGVEDESVRTLSNPSPTEPMRIDFHQMIRDWRVDLYRYGLRLTYDIVVPAPGIDLLANVDELRRIDYQLGQPLRFTTVPSDITRASWQDLTARYGADVEAPDAEIVEVHGQMAFPALSKADAAPPRFDTLDFDIPSGYYLEGGFFEAWVTLYIGGHFDLAGDPAAPIGHNADGELRSYGVDLAYLKGRTGHIALVMFSNGVAGGHAAATLRVAQDTEGWRAWQNRAWAAMRKGAEEQWQMQRQDLQQRRDRLNEEISRWDPLSLRRMEREEVMKTTLKWIFGPAFDLMPSEVARLYGGDAGALAAVEPARLTPEQWAQTMGFGEFIKFLHQAIEWENVLFFVYPYFWDNPRNHAMKRFLYHPDSVHQTFLRGGAARVVLTVRPGFEESFTRLFETGSPEADPTNNISDHPYLTIAEEIRAYAAANYPGIPGDGPTGEPTDQAVEEAERGQHIARWHEYTPISALDITVNTPLTELS